MKSDRLHFIAFNSAHKTVLFNVFLHELFVKFRSKRIIDKSFVFLLNSSLLLAWFANLETYLKVKVYKEGSAFKMCLPL